MARLRMVLFSLQTKLALSGAAATLVALGVAGAVFVVREREDRREQALDRVAAASPAIYQQAFLALLPRPDDDPFSETLDALADEQDVRILLLSPDSVVLYDTGARLGGAEIEVPRSSFSDVQRGFVAWEPPPAFPEQDLTFVSASTRFVSGSGRELPFRIVLAVESDTIASAWLGVLPGLGLAALVALPLSWLAALLLGRQVARPVQRLTAASEAMARGDFSPRVEAERDDELGRLARSFTTMAERVGQRDAQMRTLLANVSHDLKTPMTSITGFAQSLADGTADDESVPRIGTIIRDEAEHVNSLLADLLYLGEIDAGQLVAQRIDAPLAGIVARCLRRIEPTAREKKIAVDVAIAEGLTLADVDPEKVERALTNVVDNAAKFTPPDGRIAVTGTAADGMAVCEVLNTGPAIPEEDLRRVFDRFYRGDRARRASHGSGLGLAIARELVTLNGGSIAIRNEGEGVAVVVSLPARRTSVS